MRRLAYLLAGLLLLPLCVAVTRTVITLVLALRVTGTEEVSRGAWWLAGGFALWMAAFFLLSRPMRTYVLAHELTHALWGMAMGARVSKLRVSKQGGSVTLSKTNFLVTLAPYFFPLYTVLVILAHAVTGLFVDTRTYEPLWLGLVGASWGFHLTFTMHALAQPQPDIAAHGRLFSYAVIYIMNVLGIGLWIVAVGAPAWTLFASSLATESMAAYGGALALFGRSLQAAAGWFRR